jgi:MFS family permease
VSYFSVFSASANHGRSLFNNIRIIEYWTDYFDDPHGSKLGLLTSMYSIGSIASLPFAPYISDHWGRKTAIFVGCIIMIIAGAIQAASQNFGMFEGARFLMGSVP